MLKRSFNHDLSGKTKAFIIFIFLLFLSSFSFAQDTLQVMLTIESPFEEPFSNRIIGCGDINGDGYDDTVLSNIGMGPQTHLTGYVYIYLGSSQPDSIPDYILAGYTDYDEFGSSVSYVGDLNNDGFADLGVGAPGYMPYPTGPNIGKVYIFFGSENFDIEPDIILTGSDYASDSWNLQFGTIVNTQGDFNNDGCDDLAIASPGPSLFWYGQVDIFFGGEDMDTEVDVHIQGQVQGEYGYSVSVGDINGDGYDDLAAGPGFLPDSEKVDIFLGGENMDPIQDDTITPCGGAVQFGRYIAMNGDISNDGYDDLMVSQMYPDQVNIYLGNQNIYLNCDYLLEYPSTVNNRHIMNLFYSNINNDSYSDPVVSIEWYEVFDYKGKVFIYYGSPVFDTIPEFTFVGENNHEYFGRIGYNLGDVNNDGNNDILLGTEKDSQCPGSDYAYIYTKEYNSIDDYLQPKSSLMLYSYPNPFFYDTNISFSLKKSELINLSVYNIRGQKVKTIIDKKMKGGEYEIVWDGKDDNGHCLGSGIYFIRLKTDKYVNVKKVIMIHD